MLIEREEKSEKKKRMKGGSKEGRKEGRKQGREEGRKGGRKEGKKEGKLNRWCRGVQACRRGKDKSEKRKKERKISSPKASNSQWFPCPAPLPP